MNKPILSAPDDSRSGLARAALVAAAIIVPLILLGVTLLVSEGFGKMAELRREGARSYETRAGLQHILSLHQDLEIGQRGFMITRDETFLEPFEAASGEVEDAFATLDDDLLPTSDLRADFAQLRRISRQKRAFVEQAIELTRSGQISEARELVASGEGKRLMDRLRSHVARMDRVERAELERKTRLTAAMRARLRNETTTLQVLLLVLLAGAGLLVVRSSAARDRASRRVRDLASRLETIFDSAKDGMIVLNPSGSIESLNPAAARMFGYAAKGLLRRDIGTLFEVAPDRGQVESFFRRLQANRSGSAPDMQEFTGRHRDGSTFPVEASISPVVLAHATLFLAVIRDISERREIEQMKGEFVATVSHELRTPLTSIAGSLSLLSGGAAGVVPSKALRLIQIAQSNSERLVRLINDILDIEKIEAGRMAFDMRPVLLASILEQGASDSAGLAGEHDISVELQSPPAGAAVLADADRLMQVLANLLSNAIKFSPRGGTVTVAVVPLDRRFRISVSDQGEGIPAEFYGRIFTKFAQADSSDTRQKAGTGLGLSIVREIVTRMGGDVSFDSARGVGTTFHVDLPAAPQAEAPAYDSSPVTPVEPHTLPLVLHVDDDPDMLRVVASAFGERAQIRSVQSVAEARRATGEHRFDAAILDIGMADGDGLELIPLLRRQRPDVSIVVFTAQDADLREPATVDAVLVKSRVTLDKLVAEVLRLAGGHAEGVKPR